MFIETHRACWLHKEFCEQNCVCILIFLPLLFYQQKRVEWTLHIPLFGHSSYLLPVRDKKKLWKFLLFLSTTFLRLGASRFSYERFAVKIRWDFIIPFKWSQLLPNINISYSAL
jgi:hypothetical protein